MANYLNIYLKQKLANPFADRLQTLTYPDLSALQLTTPKFKIFISIFRSLLDQEKNQKKIEP
jgi:hypothetical protein